MSENERPSEEDIDNIKKALVAAGFLKSINLSEEERARLTSELAKHGVDARRNWTIICSRAHWCLVIARS
jgi:hypothetical protein